MQVAHALIVLFSTLLFVACGPGTAPKSAPPAPAQSTPAENAPPEAAPADAPSVAGSASEAPDDHEDESRTGWLGQKAQGAPDVPFASLTGSADFSSGLDDSNVYGGLIGEKAGSLSPFSAEVQLISSVGSLGKEISEEVLGLAQLDLDLCTDEKMTTADLAIVRVKFRINAKGKTSKVVAKGRNKKFAKCVRAVVLALQFPESKKTSTVVTTVTPMARSGGWGYGISGVGTGGGGTGWGTIGTGKYGTIGHGGGTGSGYGSGSGAGGIRVGSKPPQVRIGNATSTGALDKNIIRRYMRRELPRIRHCYEKELLVKPKLRGIVTVSFVIAASGAVEQAAAKGMSPVVSSCVAAAIKRIQFPKPKGGGIVTVSYPFNFVPSRS